MNQANLRTLREAIEADPLGLGWPAMEPDALAASINAATVARRRLVPLWELHKRAIESGFLLAIETASFAHPDPAAYVAARLAVRYMNNPRFDNLDMDNAATVAMLDAMVGGGVLTAEQRGEIDALADETHPFSVTIGAGEILPGHILKARAL